MKKTKTLMTESNDPSLRALRALLNTLTDPKDKTEVQAAIDQRIRDIQIARLTVALIDPTAKLDK